MFLYAAYGPTAPYWQVEELVRKLLPVPVLSAVIVLFNDESPLQATLAVLVCVCSHVLHASFAPWGRGSMLFALQHGALSLLFFV